MTDEAGKLTQAYVDGFCKRVYGQHQMRVEEVCVAFLSRHGIDPDDAQVVTEGGHTPEGGFKWVTYIERRQ